MKHKEINLSSASLDTKQEFEKNILEEKQPEVKKVEKVGIKKKIARLKENIRAWWQAAPKKKKILVIAIPALLILGTSAFFFYYTIYGPRNRPPELFSISTNYVPPKGFEKNKLYGFNVLKLSKPSVPRTEESPINGKLFTKEEMEKLKGRRPVAVMVNYHAEARPTSNLPQADLVYEALVEGNITRLLAIYWSKEPNKVGPIRSARQYYLEWLSEYDPLFIYDGFAASADPRVNAGGNISSYGIKSIYTVGAWRVNDRFAPHNEYSSIVKAWEYADKQGWNSFPEIEAWKFKSDAPENERADRFKAKVSISATDTYNSHWEYDKATNLYLRNIAGIPDTDLETKQQISAKNVVIQEVKIEGPVDQYNRLIITTIGSGNAAILQDGKVIYGKWEKKDRTSRTKFYDASNNEVQFNRGAIWISAVRQLETNFDIIEQ